MGISSTLFLPDRGLRMRWACLARRIPAAYHAIYDVWYFLYRGFGFDPGVRSFERKTAVRAKDERISGGRDRLGSGIELVARSPSGHIPLCSVGELEIRNPSYGRVGNGSLAQPRGTSFSGKHLRAGTRISLSWRSEGNFRERRANSRAPRDVESPASHGFAALEARARRRNERLIQESVGEMERRKDGGWHVSGYAVCRDDRPPDLILFCTRNADGEWVVRTTATPFSASPQYLRNSARYDSSFWEAGLRTTQLARGRLIFRLESLAPRKGEPSPLGRWISRGGVITTILKAIVSFSVQSAMIGGKLQGKF